MRPPSADDALRRLFVPLETARLRLEPIRAELAASMFSGLQEPSLYRYQIDEKPRTLADLRERYARLASGLSPDRRQFWLNWIACVRESDDAAGYVQATVEANLSSAVIGYLVLVARQGRGFGTEAVGAMVEHLVAQRIGAIHATIDERNHASLALIERLGFVRVRRRRSEDVIDGVRGYDYDYELPRRPRTGAAEPNRRSPAS